MVGRSGHSYLLVSIFSMKCEARSLAKSGGGGRDVVGIQMEDMKCSFWRVRNVLGLPTTIEL